MCGIAGWFNTSARKPKALLEAMRERLRHRGPDDSGHVVFQDGVVADEGTVGLGHARLSVIDTSPAGRQPLSDPTGRYWIVYNGEIYNYREVRRSHVAAPPQSFGSATDTEVLLHACVEHGAKALELLHGIFAFAIYDALERSLFLARDRSGVKPLYYYDHAGEFVFASELKAIFCYLGGCPGVDTAALHEYLAQGYIGGEHTISRNTHRLAPGSWLRVNADGSRESGSYWQLDHQAIASAEHVASLQEHDVVERTEAVIRQAVREQLVSDVPLGTLLSGGIDSTLVTCLAAQEAGRTLSTFTIGFEEPRFDESGYAAAIARHVGTDHHSLTVGEADCLTAVPALADMFDEPFADSSAIPTLLLSRFARQSVTVALSGDGADEQFYGYDTYRHMERLEQLYRMPAPLRKAIAAGRQLPFLTADARLKLASLGYSDFESAKANLTNLPAAMPSFLTSAAPLLAAAQQASLCSANRLMLNDLMGYMIDDVLVKVDRASMSTALEVRVPLLDQAVIENSFHTVPLALKVPPRPPKWVLKRILARHVPPALFERPKQGFAVPLVQWVNGVLKDELTDRLASPSLLWEQVKQSRLQVLARRKGFAGAKYGARFLWQAFVFLRWEERFCRGTIHR